MMNIVSLKVDEKRGKEKRGKSVEMQWVKKS